MICLYEFVCHFESRQILKYIYGYLFLIVFRGGLFDIYDVIANLNFKLLINNIIKSGVFTEMSWVAYL